MGDKPDDHHGRSSAIRGRARAVAGIGCRLLPASPASAQSLTDRFKSLFGGKSDRPAQARAVSQAPAEPTEI